MKVFTIKVSFDSQKSIQVTCYMYFTLAFTLNLQNIYFSISVGPSGFKFTETIVCECQMNGPGKMFIFVEAKPNFPFEKV